MWEISTGRCVRTFKGHTGFVMSVCLSADNHWALSGSEDETLRLWEVSTGRCVRTFEGHKGDLNSVCLSADGRWALTGSKNHTLCLWELDWQYEFPGWADWDEGARPYLENFLTMHTPYSKVGWFRRRCSPKRQGSPSWNEEDLQQLIATLQDTGYGWLRPEGVRNRLKEMAANWQGPTPLPGTK